MSKKKRKESIDEIIKRVDEYNKEHNTRLSYGKFLALEQMGKLKKTGA